jgi:hypothetical protein
MERIIGRFIHVGMNMVALSTFAFVVSCISKFDELTEILKYVTLGTHLFFYVLLIVSCVILGLFKRVE